MGTDGRKGSDTKEKKKRNPRNHVAKGGLVVVSRSKGKKHHQRVACPAVQIGEASAG